MKNIDHIKQATLLVIFILTSLNTFFQKMVLASGARINVSTGTYVINPGDLTNGSDAILYLTGNMTVSGILTNSAGTSGLVVTLDESYNGSLIENSGVNAIYRLVVRCPLGAAYGGKKVYQAVKATKEKKNKVPNP